jgi:hypothetical protein
MKTRNIFFITIFFTFSCATNNSNILYSIIECPESVRENVVIYAQEYVQRETWFELGGRDYLEKEGVLELDCSGLIVRVYQYATKGTKYSLPFEDTNVSSIYSYFTIPVDKPTPGDIIFMGETPVFPTHMSIFVSMDNENIYFIDSTVKEEFGIDGVTLRSYPIGDPKFLSFGRLLVRI